MPATTPEGRVVKRKSQSEMRRERVARGLCGQCGKRPLVTTYFCEPCRQAQIRYNKRNHPVGTDYRCRHCKGDHLTKFCKRHQHKWKLLDVEQPACVCGLRGEHVCIAIDPTRGLGQWHW